MNVNMHDENNNCGYGIMLKDFSNIYVLVSKNNLAAIIDIEEHCPWS